MTAYLWIAIGYLYLAGIANGLLICGLDEDANGIQPTWKMVCATVLWPVLIPALWVVVKVRALS